LLPYDLKRSNSVVGGARGSGFSHSERERKSRESGGKGWNANVTDVIAFVPTKLEKKLEAEEEVWQIANPSKVVVPLTNALICQSK